MSNVGYISNLDMSNERNKDTEERLEGGGVIMLRLRGKGRRKKKEERGKGGKGRKGLNMKSVRLSSLGKVR